MFSWFTTLLLAVGPLLDPMLGETVRRSDRELLPVAPHVSGMADMWFAEIVNLQNDSGGIELFDPVYLSAHGRAWSQMHFALNGLDLTDPAHPGSPLIDLPQQLWDSVTFASLWTDRPGFTWTLTPSQQTGGQAWGTLGGAAGSAYWLPGGVFDRAPAYPYGAPRERRELRNVRDVGVRADVATQSGAWRVLAEHLDHDQHYPTLGLPDLAQRSSVFAIYAGPLADMPMQLVVGWQMKHRDHAGAQFRWPVAFTAKQQSQAVLAQLSAGKTFASEQKLQWGLSAAWRRDDATSYGQSPWVDDLLTTWLYLARPTPPAFEQRLAVNGHLRGLWHAWSAGLRAQAAWLATLPHIPGNRQGLSANGVPAYMLVYEAPQRTQTLLADARIDAGYKKTWGAFSTEWNTSIDYSHANSIDSFAPAVGVAARWQCGDATLFALLRREPDYLTNEVGRFTDRNTASATRYAWQDINGDAVPDLAEAGAVVSHTGGRYHDVDATLSRPVNNQFAIGYRTPVFGPFRGVLTGVARVLQNRYTVTQPGAQATPTAFHDPGGDGRGETAAPGGGQVLNVYAQDLSSLAQARYKLTNDSRSAYYLGVELELMSERTRYWFLTLGGAAYLSAGAAPFGNGPDLNDPGVVSEWSASPNAQVNDFGRYDHDRSFALKIMTGVTPTERTSVTISARYRDGQPFTRMLLVSNLPQGPTALMAVPRGAPRYTFYMTWNLRARYVLPFQRVSSSLNLDVFNILDPAVELIEDPRTGANFRRPLEVNAKRGVMLSMELAWQE